MDTAITRISKVILGIILLLAVLWLISAIHKTVILVVISALIAYILDPAASYLEFRGLSRLQATIVIFLVLGGIIALVITLLVPSLVHEVSLLQKTTSGESAAELMAKFENGLKATFPILSDQNLNFQGQMHSMIENAATSFLAIAVNVVTIISTLVIIPFAVFFLLKDGRGMMKSLISIVPNKYFEMALNLFHKIDIQLGGYLRGQFLDSLIIGSLALVALWILGVPYFVVIGIFAGLANMIPYVGPVSGATAAILVVLVNHGTGNDVLWVAAAFGIIQLIDNVVVQPLVLAKSVDLHPLAIILVIIIGGQFFGIIGMLVAVPLTGITKVLTIEFYHTIRRFNIG